MSFLSNGTIVLQFMFQAIYAQNSYLTVVWVSSHFSLTTDTPLLRNENNEDSRYVTWGNNVSKALKLKL